MEGIKWSDGVKALELNFSRLKENKYPINADMEINIAKTKAQHVREQDQVSKTTNAEASKLCKFVCPHLNCNFRFYSKRGLQVHMGKCKWKNDFEIEKILECKGPVCVRRYLVKWKGYQETTWEPRVICTLRTLPHLKNKTIATSMAGLTDARPAICHSVRKEQSKLIWVGTTNLTRQRKSKILATVWQIGLCAFRN